MPEEIKISELPVIGKLNTSAMFPESQTENGELQTFKATAADIAAAMLGDFEYPDNLETESKKVFGAINEIDTKTIAIETNLNETDRSLDALWKLNKGQTYDFEQKLETGMNISPSGAKYESLLDVRGKSEQVTTKGYQLSSSYSLRANDTGAINLASGTLGTVVEGEDYVLSFKNNTQLNDYVSLRVYNGTEQVRITNFALTPNARTVISFTALASGDVMLNKALGVQYANQDVFTEIMLEVGSVAHDFEPYTGGIASPNPAYPQPITSVEEFHFNVNGETRTITPPFPMNKIGDYYDFANIENGEWVRNIYARTVNSNDVYSYSTTRNAVVLRYTDYLAKKVFSSAEMKTLIMKSDSFTGVPWTEYKNDVDGLATVQYSTTGETESFIQLRDLSLTTVDMWKNWLDSNNILIMYVLMNSISEPIDTADLEYLKSLTNLDVENNIITITDQNGNDVSYLMEYIIKLNEVN